MSTARTASCPGCGGTIEIASAATLTVVCPYCHGASYRTDRDLELFGKVAEVAPIASPLSIGYSGRHGSRQFTVVGQVQLDHGTGPWNEWCLLLDSGAWAWYAEAQGETLLTSRMDGAEGGMPAWSSVKPGTAVELGGKVFVVAEIGDAVVTAARGELPTRIAPGSRRRYADLRGPDDAFATLDYGVGERCEDVFVGKTVDPAALGIDAAAAEPVERRATAARLSCPKCAGVIELRDPESVRVVCASCGSLLAHGDWGAKVLGVGAALQSKPTIPLGRKGTLAGVESTVIAYLVRSVTVDGLRYPWREYLLQTKKGAYRWLVESSGHWALLDPINQGDVGRGPGGPTFRGVEFRHFQSGKAKVDHVQGEVYWEVAVGETVRSEDYVAPPHLLTIESSGKEINATAGAYVAKEDVEAAFGVELRDPIGVAPAQPNPYRGRVGRWWLAGLALFLGLVVLMVLVSTTTDADHVGVFFPGIFFLFALLLPPIVVSTRSGRFEVRRWEDSDHPIAS